jgi:hypothetical protein
VCSIQYSNYSVGSSSSSSGGRVYQAGLFPRQFGKFPGLTRKRLSTQGDQVTYSWMPRSPTDTVVHKRKPMKKKGRHHFCDYKRPTQRTHIGAISPKLPKHKPSKCRSRELNQVSTTPTRVPHPLKFILVNINIVSNITSIQGKSRVVTRERGTKLT